jgi:hypothetical protein
MTRSGQPSKTQERRQDSFLWHRPRTAIGWLYEGVNCIRERDIASVQHIYNILEQHPGRAMHEAATDAGKDTMFLIRVTHSSGMLEGQYTAETTFPPTDHRSHRPRSWLLNGIKKVDRLRFLESSERTLGQAALQWLLADERVASTLPNIYNAEQLIEFTKAPETPPLTSEELARLEDLYSENFGLDREETKYKGTMAVRPRRRFSSRLWSSAPLAPNERFFKITPLWSPKRERGTWPFSRRFSPNEQFLKLTPCGHPEACGIATGRSADLAYSVGASDWLLV